jgi:hypothetical protein
MRVEILGLLVAKPRLALRQASAEKNPYEARRLMSFARHWTRLADAEDWQRAQAAA